MILPALKFVQICYVVANLEQACARFHKTLGIAPFVGGGDVVLGHHTYRGQPTDPIIVRGAFGQSGDLNIELVELVSPGPSAFRDMYPGRQEGLHHAAIFCADYAATRDTLIAQGMPLASEFETDFGTRICYIDACALMGHMLELYPENAIIREMYARTRFETDHWDGSRLIVPW